MAPTRRLSHRTRGGGGSSMLQRLPSAFGQAGSGENGREKAAVTAAPDPRLQCIPVGDAPAVRLGVLAGPRTDRDGVARRCLGYRESDARLSEDADASVVP